MSVFEVEIGPGISAGTFTVQVVDSSPSVGEATETVPLDVDGLLRRREELQQALLTSAVRNRRRFGETERVIMEVGRDLFRALLGTGEVACLYRVAASRAGVEGLRVVLRIEDPVLAGLPWEAMYDPGAGGYVCRAEDLVRRVPVPLPPAPLTVRPPLRILAIVASPRGLPMLNSEKEKDQLAQALKPVTTTGQVELCWAAEATWSHLQQVLQSDVWHVVHFIGHGDFDVRQDTGLLDLVDGDGYVHEVPADQFVTLLRQTRPNPLPPLVVLNSCAGAETGQSDLFGGTAGALVRGGVTAVAAMQFAISDEAAIAFSGGFYAAVAHGRGIDMAVSCGRAAIMGLHSKTLEWVTPVLYLRGDQTRLFTVTISNPVDVHSKPALGGLHEPIETKPANATAKVEASPPKSPQRPDDAPEPTDGLPPTLDDTTAVTAATNGIVIDKEQSPHPGEKPSPDRPIKPVGLHKSIDTNPASATGQATGSPATSLQRLGNDAPEVADRPAATLDDVIAVTVERDGIVAVEERKRPVPLRAPPADRPIETVDPFALLGPPGTADFDYTKLALADFKLGHTLTGFSGRSWLADKPLVSGVGFSPDGRVLASVGNDKQVRLWDPATGEHVRTLTGHKKRLFAVAFSPGGKLLASADGSCIRLWDPATGEPVRTLTPGPWHVNTLAFSPDGQLLATACGGNEVELWNLASGQHLHTQGCDGNYPGTTGLAFSPDGQLLATCSGRMVWLWDPDGQPVRILMSRRATDEHQWATELEGLAFSPDGKLLATCSYDQMWLWDPTTGEPLRAVKTRCASGAVTFSPDGQLLAFSSIYSVDLLDPATSRFLGSLSGHTARVNAVTFSPDGQLIASASDDKTVRLWRSNR